MRKIIFTIIGLALVANITFANIIHDYISGKVVRATCPEDKPLMDNKGFCHSCFELAKIEVLEAVDIVDMCHTSDGHPIREEKGGHFRTKDTYLIVCPDTAPLKMGEKGCLPCNYPGSFEIAEEECLKCNVDGKNVRTYENGNCKLSDCTNNPLRGIDGGCYPCDFEEDIQTIPGTCKATCSNRQQTGTARYGNLSIEYCSLKKEDNAIIPNNCPPEKPILDEMGECRACDFYRESIHAFSGCDKCPNREENGVWFSDAGSGRMCKIKE